MNESDSRLGLYTVRDRTLERRVQLLERALQEMGIPIGGVSDNEETTFSRPLLTWSEEEEERGVESDAGDSYGEGFDLPDVFREQIELLLRNETGDESDGSLDE